MGQGTDLKQYESPSHSYPSSPAVSSDKFNFVVWVCFYLALPNLVASQCERDLFLLSKE